MAALNARKTGVLRNVRPAQRQELEDDVVSEEGSVDEGDQEEDHESGSELEEDQEEVPQAQFSTISFGALKQAQDALSRKRKRGSDTNEDQGEKLEALRKRLREIKEQKTPKQKLEKKQRKTGANDEPLAPRRETAKVTEDEVEEVDQDSDSDSAPSEEGASAARTSKHAPAAQSTRHQVSRKRQVIDVPRRVVRDPRFDAIHHSSTPNHNADKAYAFLTDYQKSEIAELKAALKKVKSEDEKELLKRKINAMENRLKAKDAKEREQKVMREHRKAERAKVEEGKMPFYLKKKELKERALTEKFKSMKGKEREKLIERRKRKEGQKERRKMPMDRRMGAV
ncbi:pre-rRNA processing protein [Teratosphaeria destructans]|uniref:rRNA biogenesis protein RRP36 n=1 Tax=Teratosphaeria destructans TaxID=418781 RepID=A0A9W7SZB9_9PEZI|nr:pre-rRNA processing protein [Teratosphaeria destructans]